MEKLYLINKTTGAKLDLLSDMYLLQRYDLGKVDATRATTQYINLIGKHVDSSTLGVRDMSITCTVKCNNEMQLKEQKKFLNNFFNPLHILELHFEEYVIDVMPDSSIVYSLDKRAHSNTYQAFTVSLTAYYPLWKYAKGQSYADGSIQAVPLFPLVVPANKGISFGYIPAITVNNPANEGDVDTGFIVQFTAKVDNVTNPKITNNKTGEYIEVMVNMLQGDTVEISTVSGDKYAKLIRGSSETDLINSVTNSSTFGLCLNVGINDIGISNASANVTNMTASITYAPSFIEVR